jgi:sugar (pentulose or hexulose) kinase
VDAAPLDVILTVDLGTSATKVMVWSSEGPVGAGRAELATSHPQPGRAEQDPAAWWASVVTASEQLGAGQRAAVSVMVFAAARETFVPVDGDGRPLGPGLLWSDRRAGAEAASLAATLADFRLRTGVHLDAGSPLAKLAWLRAHEPERLAAARWLMAPRDVVVFGLTGTAVTDRTLAGRAGWIALDGTPVEQAAPYLPPVLAPTDLAGQLRPAPAAELGLPAGIPVVIGAGDRACEVLGSASGPGRAMVSWGSTANVSLPSGVLPDPLPAGASLSPGARSGWLVEYGMSAAGAGLDWLAGLTGWPPARLASSAFEVDAGAGGVLIVPWLNGARAPWWRPGARAAIVGLDAGHGPGHLARAWFEAVAFEVARGVESAGGVVELVAAGGGAASSGWLGLLAAVTGCPVSWRRSTEAASAGACLLAGRDVDVDLINPAAGRVSPDPALVASLAPVRARSDAACAAALRDEVVTE